MFDGFTVQNVLYLSSALFCIGIYGVMARRNILVVLMSLELMLNAVNLSLVAFGRVFASAPDALPATMHTAQVFALMVMAVAAAEAAIGLSILLLIFRKLRTIDVRDVCRMQW